MKVILKQEVINLGKVGDQVVVKPGYGRNYLLPQGVAALATAENLAIFETKRAELEKKAAEVLAAAQARAKILEKLDILISTQAGDAGKLFGSIGARDLADAINEQAKAKDVSVNKQEIVLSEGPFRQTGEYVVDLKLHSEVTVPLTLKIVAAGSVDEQE